MIMIKKIKMLKKKEIEFIHEQDRKVDGLPIGIYKYKYGHVYMFVLLHVRCKGSITPILNLTYSDIHTMKCPTHLPYREIPNIVLYR